MAKKQPAEIQRDRDTRQQSALLLCGEFFRDELEFYEPSARLRRKFEKLRDIVFDALDNPTEADAVEIRRRFSALRGRS